MKAYKTLFDVVGHVALKQEVDPNILNGPERVWGWDEKGNQIDLDEVPGEIGTVRAVLNGPSFTSFVLGWGEYGVTGSIRGQYIIGNTTDCGLILVDWD